MRACEQASDIKCAKGQQLIERQRAVLAGMPQAGLDPVVIYAFKRTDRMVTDSNKHLLSKRELRQWNDAINEYQHKVDSGKVV